MIKKAQRLWLLPTILLTVTAVASAIGLLFPIDVVADQIVGSVHRSKWSMISFGILLSSGLAITVIILLRKLAQLRSILDEGSRKKFSTIFNRSLDMIVLIDPDTGQFVKINPIVHSFLGYEPSDLIGKDFSIIFLSETNMSRKELLETLRVHGAIVSSQRFLHKNGSVVLMDLSAALIPWGESKMILATLRDVTERSKAEKELSENRERYRILFENSPLGILSIDIDGNITNINQAMLDMFGYSSVEVMGAVNMLTFPPSVKAGISSSMRRCLESGESILENTSYTNKSGKQNFARLHLVPIRNTSSKIVGLQAIVEDITDRRNDEERLNTLIRSIPDAILYQIGGDIEYISSNIEGVLGYNAEQFTEDRGFFLTLIHPDDVGYVRRTHDEWKKNDRKGTTETEFRVRRRDGQYIWLLDRMTCVFRPSDGRYSYNGVMIDITERKITEEKLRLSEEFNRDLITESPVGIAYLDQKGYVVFINPAMFNMMGDPDENDIIGKHIYELFGKEQKHLRENFTQLLLGETVETEEIEYIRNDVKKIFNLHGAPRFDSKDKVIGAMLMIVDVTEYKKLEAQLRHAVKMEAVGTLAGGIAHDFNNLLTVILGHTQLVMNKVKKNSVEYISLEAIRRSTNRAADITARLLAFGRRKMERPEPLNLNDPIDEVVRLLRLTLDTRIELKVDLMSNLWTVMADSGQMQQILMNLVLNALDVIKETGTIILRTKNVIIDADYCRTRTYAKEGKYVLLTVSDTGTGIPEEILPHVFEPFFTTKKATEGSGLGLAMVYGTVKAHNGWIEVESTLGIGTIFYIHLPQIEERKIKIKEELPSTRELPRGGSESILLVDDDKLILDVVNKMLTTAGYHVIIADNGMKAIERYQDAKSNGNSIDLVILDLSMPKKAGRETLHDLIELDSRVKIIVGSGFDGGEELENELLSMGAKGIIYKPYKLEKLLDTIRRVLDQ